MMDIDAERLQALTVAIDSRLMSHLRPIAYLNLYACVATFSRRHLNVDAVAIKIKSVDTAGLITEF